MEIKITKELADEIMKEGGVIRGWDLKTMIDFLLKESGKEGLEKVKEVLKNLGYPFSEISLSQIKFSPLGLRVLIILAATEALGWEVEKIREWGEYVGKKLLILKIFAHLFRIKEEFFFKDLPKISTRYLKGIKVIPLEADKDKKYCIFKIKKFKFPPLAEKIGLVFYEGFYKGFAQMVLGKRNIECETVIEEEYYKFTIKWK